MIICSIILVGKPLHMHGRTAIVHLHICQHPHQIYQMLQRFWTSLSLFQTPFSCLWHSPPGILVYPHTTNLLTDSNIGTIKQINHNTVKTIKIRWVYAQSSNQYKNIYTVTIIQHSINTTKLGVSADIVCSSPTNMGHKQHFNARSY